jgi:hypothetical protein
MRFYSAEEIAVLADRTHMRIEAGRPVHLKLAG